MRLRDLTRQLTCVGGFRRTVLENPLVPPEAVLVASDEEKIGVSLGVSEVVLAPLAQLDAEVALLNAQVARGAYSSAVTA